MEVSFTSWPVAQILKSAYIQEFHIMAVSRHGIYSAEYIFQSCINDKANHRKARLSWTQGYSPESCINHGYFQAMLLIQPTD